MLLLAVFALVGWGALPIRSAWGQTDGELSVARKFYQAGLKHEKGKRWQEALDSYNKALAIKSTPQLHLRAAVCNENLGHLAQALDGYERSLEQAKLGGNAEVTRLVGERLGELRPRVPTLTIKIVGEHDDLVVKLDGEAVASAILGVAIPVDPGGHEVGVRAKNKNPVKREIELEEGAREVLTIELSSASKDAPKPVKQRDPEEIEVDNYIPGALVLGIGVAALGVGVALFIVQAGIESDVDDLCGGSDRLACPSDREAEVRDDLDSAETFRITSFVVGGVGAAAAITGIILLIAPPTTTKVSDTALRPHAPGADIGASLHLRF